MMKKLLLITLGFGMAATVSAQGLKTYSKFKGSITESSSFAPTGLKLNPLYQGLKTNSMPITYVTLGTSPNAFTNLLSDVNPITVNPATNAVVFIHRNTAAVTGSGNSGNLRYDLSTDGGNTFTLDQGPLNPLNTNVARHPQVSLYNPTGNTSASNAYLVYSGSTLSAGAFGTTVTGVRKLDGTGNTENQAFNATFASQGTSLVERIPGEYWIADFNGLLNLQQAYKGVFNTTTNDVDWTVAVTFPDTMANSASNSIGFDPSGQKGWYVALADFKDSTLVTGKFNPIFYNTLDGGLTWSSAIKLELDSFAIITDTFTFAASFSTAFEGDIVVDAAGSPHFVATIAAKSPTTDYSVNTGRFTQGLYDFTYNTIAQKWEATQLAILASFRGAPTNEPTLYSLDTRPQASRSKDGTKVFFAYTDTEVVNQADTGDNTFPDLRMIGLDITTGLLTEDINVTGGGDFDAVAYLTSVAAEAVPSSNGQIIPAVVATLGALNTNPVTHTYLNGVEILNSQYTFPRVFGVSTETVSGIVAVSNNLFNVSNNYPNPFSGKTQVNLNLEKASLVKLTLTNTLGQVVSQKSQNFAAGTSILDIDATELSTGVYFYTVYAGGFQVTNKMIVR